MSVTDIVGWRALFVALTLVWACDAGWRKHRADLQHAQNISSEIGRICIEGSVASHASTDEIWKCTDAEIAWQQKLIEGDLEEVEFAVGWRLGACLVAYLLIELVRWTIIALIRAVSN